MILLIVLLAALVLLVLGFVFVPLARCRAARAVGRDSFARAVYRDQLAELTRDRDRGVVDPRDEDAARREIERRLLAADQVATTGDTKPRPVLSVLLGLATLIVAAGLYAVIGRPGLPDRPYAGRARRRCATP
jgi:cytochrome c-type biogenesis protein CcmH